MSSSDEVTSATPLQRLLQSRERLREALAPPLASPDVRAEACRFSWLDGLMSIPGATVLKEALQGWWAQHPLRAATLVANAAGKSMIQPAAQKHPWMLVTGALLVGAAVVWVRPWRWGLKRALLAGLLPQLISKVVTEIPVASWLTVVSELAQQKGTPAHAPTPTDGPDLKR